MNPIKDMLTAGDNSWALVKVLAFVIVVGMVTEHVYLTIHLGAAQPWNWSELAGLLGGLTASIAHKALDKSGQTPPPIPPATP